jgi:hypothetical protein
MGKRVTELLKEFTKVSDNQDFRKYGGLKPFLPLTYSVMLIASLSLVALPFMTGFYSKDFILESAYGQFYFSKVLNSPCVEFREVILAVKDIPQTLSRCIFSVADVLNHVTDRGVPYVAHQEQPPRRRHPSKLECSVGATLETGNHEQHFHRPGTQPP